MADDGGAWRNGLEVGLAPTARDRFRDVLAEFAERLNAPLPMRRETAVTLVQQLERLGRRMAHEQDLTDSRAADLDAALTAITRRLEAEVARHAAREAELTARVDSLLGELAAARAAKRPFLDARGVRAIVAAAAVCAALAVGATMIRRPQAPRVPAAPVVVPVEVAATEAEPAPSPPFAGSTDRIAQPLAPAGLQAEPRAPRKAHSVTAPKPDAEAGDPSPPDAGEGATGATDPAPAQAGVLSSASLKDTQTFLAQQGYYIGSIDGLVSVTLKDAAEAYLRDHKAATLP